MRKLSFLVFSEDPTVRSNVSDQLTATSRVRVQSVVSQSEDLIGELQRHQVDGIYLDVDQNPDSVFALISELREPLVGLPMNNDADLYTLAVTL